jgi:rubredoxin
MKIKTINSQSRRDFYADYECEHCGFIYRNRSGYDDTFFHETVIPKMKCPKCGKTAKDNYRPLNTKFQKY